MPVVGGCGRVGGGRGGGEWRLESGDGRRRSRAGRWVKVDRKAAGAETEMTDRLARPGSARYAPIARDAKASGAMCRGGTGRHGRRLAPGGTSIANSESPAPLLSEL